MIRALLLIFFIFGICTSAVAQESSDSKSDIKAYDLIGVESDRPQWMADDFWKDLTYTEYLTLIKAMPTNLDANLRTQQRAILISPISDLEKKNPDAKGLLYARIEKLIALGLFKDALVLFQSAQKLSLNASTIKLGLAAALFNRKNDLACIEYKAALSRKAISEWSALTKLCDKVSTPPAYEESNPLLPPALPDVTLVSLKTFKEADLFEKSLFFANTEAQSSNHGDLSFSDRPDPVTLRFLDTANNNDPALAFKTEVFLNYYGLPVREKRIAGAVSGGEYQRMITLKTKSSPENLKKEALSALMDNKKTYPHNFYKGLLESHVLGYKPELINDEFIYDVALIKALNKEEISFLENLHRPKNLISSAYPITVINVTGKASVQDLDFWLKSYCEDNQTFSQSYCLHVFALLRNYVSKEENEKADLDKFQSYEKFIRLTKDFDYVMPIDGDVVVNSKTPYSKYKGFNLLQALNSGDFYVYAWDFPLEGDQMTFIKTLFDDESWKSFLIKHLQDLKEKDLKGDTKDG